MSELTFLDKFSIVLGQTFTNIGTIIGELNVAGKTELNTAMVDALKDYTLSKDKKYLIDSFINTSCEYWEQIKNKDENCLLNNSDKILGEYVNKPEFSSIKLIFSSHIDNESKQYIWDCLASLVKLSIHYVLEERGASIKKTIIDGKNSIRITYKNKDLYPQVDITKQNRLWSLGLF